MNEVAELLDAGGPLAQALEGFNPRRDQQRMAQAVADALAERRTLVVEAGTGTGKTFAYLVPALVSGLKVLISTGTKNLQDQLFSKDLPQVREALSRPVSVALLKGRANYLCTQRLEQAQLTGRFDARDRAAELQTIIRWANTTRDGDVAEVEGVPEDSSIWPWVTSTAENCLGSKCAHYDDCFVLAARRRALTADVVVINHHLLFADLMLKESGFGELLPGADAVIVDEAHQLAETASQFFGTVVTGRSIADLARDATAAFVNDVPDFKDLQVAAGELEKAERELRLVLLGPNVGAASNVGAALWPRQKKGGREAAAHLSRDKSVAPTSGSRRPWHQWPRIDKVEAALDDIDATLARLIEVLAAVAGRAPSLEQAQERAATLRAELNAVRGHVGVKSPTASDGPLTVDQLSGHGAAPERLDPNVSPSVRWIESFRQSYALHLTPLDVSGPLAALFGDASRSWVFTSATLAIGERFDHFTQALGLVEPDTLQLGSPFDYEHNAMLYVPQRLPEPNTPGFTQAVLDEALPVIAAAGGRAFLLFTSHRALREAADFLEGRFAFPLLVQGTAPRDALLREFRERGNAVLLGTGSFWEGVDVRGPALSVVVIDKLPFAAPDDPVLSARIDAINKSGGNAFMEHQLPRAVIALKQGVGRLIRDADDTGVMMICDPRLATKGYGRVFLNSLPPMRRTRDRAEVLDFIAKRL